MKGIRFLAAITVVVSMLLLTSCLKLYTTAKSTESSTPEPLTAEWQMTRLSTTPAIPIPEMIMNQLISDKATWKIVRQGGQLTVKYDGRDTWYKSIIGLNIEKKPTTVTENPAKTSATFNGGGSINVDKLPALLSAISQQKMEQISVNFDDKVQINLASANKITATINVNTSGKYYGETEFGGSMKWKTLQQSNTITYEGIKK